jgi:hypothetical protein
MSATAVAVIGDVGGHRACLRTALARVGADLDAADLPDGLVVIQVGDLVGGPDDAALVEDVDRLTARYPGRWLQLIGNWEAQFLGGPAFVRSGAATPVDPAAAAGVRRLWAERRLHPAVGVASGSGIDVLITHAGLSREFWRCELGAPASAADAARELAVLARRDRGVLFRPGALLAETPVAGPAGPLWAVASTEVWPSWLEEAPPFGQVHGHTSPYFFGGRRWNDEVTDAVRQRSRVIAERRHIWFDAAPGRRIVGIDPGLGRRPRGGELHALLLRTATVVGDAAAA